MEGGGSCILSAGKARTCDTLEKVDTILMRASKRGRACSKRLVMVKYLSDLQSYLVRNKPQCLYIFFNLKINLFSVLLLKRTVELKCGATSQKTR